MSLFVETTLQALLEREGGYRPAVQRPNGTEDPPTMFGITAPVLGNWRGLNRPATAQEVQALTPAEAKAIYRARFITQPGFDTLGDGPLVQQLIDFGVNSGPERAIRWLQRVLRVRPTGALDVPTRQVLRELGALGLWPLVNDALVAARCYMIDRLVDTGGMAKADEEGVESRALQFFAAAPTEEGRPT